MINICFTKVLFDICLLYFFLLLMSNINCEEIKKRFEYKMSFKGPNIILNDGTIPFWDHYESTLASEDFIRITPSLKSKKGSVWSKEINTNENWEIEISLRITGRGRVGADGLAIWYTTDRGIDGPVFGNKDQWNGLGVILDSFDNDMQQNNPMIMAMLNDGTKVYDHERDGENQMLGYCLRDFRNKQFPVRIKVIYTKKVLTIYVHNGISNTENFEMCMRVEDVSLPGQGYFGVSAATGGLADDHDVLSFLTHSIHFIDEITNAGQNEEWKQYEKEYQEQRKKLEQAREDYVKDHPDKKMDEKIYEDQEIRELQMIYQGQEDIFKVVQSLTRKLDEVIGKQEGQLSLLSQISRASSGGSQGQIQAPNSLQKHDIDALTNTQKIISGEVRDLRTLILDVQAKLQQKIGQELQSSLKDIQVQMSSVQSEIRVVASNIANNCQQQGSNCVSMSYLAVFLGLHLICVIGYFLFQSSRESASKKFY